MIKGNRSLFIIFALFSTFILFLGLYFLVEKDNKGVTNRSDATEINANLHFYIRCSDTYYNPSYLDSTITGENRTNYNPYSSPPTVSITAKCSEDLYMNGTYMGDNNGSHTKTYSITNGTTIVIRAYRMTVFNIGTFNISLSVNSNENSYCLYEGLGDSSDSTSQSLGGGGRTVDLYYYLNYRPDYWKGYFNLNDGSDDDFASITQTNYRYWDLPLENPTREGYIFDGWWTEESGGSEITSTTLFQNSTSQTVYAHWIKNYNYKVREDVSGNGNTSPYQFKKILTKTCALC